MKKMGKYIENYSFHQSYNKWCNYIYVFLCFYIQDCRIFVSFYCTFPLWVQIPLDTTLCDEVCQWFAAGLSPGTPVSFTNKTDRHDITEILLNVVLNTITLTLLYNHFFSQCSEFCFQYCFFLSFSCDTNLPVIEFRLVRGINSGYCFLQMKWQFFLRRNYSI